MSHRKASAMAAGGAGRGEGARAALRGGLAACSQMLELRQGRQRLQPAHGVPSPGMPPGCSPLHGPAAAAAQRQMQSGMRHDGRAAPTQLASRLRRRRRPGRA